MNWQDRKKIAWAIDRAAERQAQEPHVFRFGSRVYRYDLVTSTQDIAREHAERLPIPGLTVTARQMTHGRGRMGRGWVAPPGANVVLTTVAPCVEPEAVWKVALVAGLAACAAVNAAAPSAEAQIRFPNDIYASGRKLAGVLVETIPYQFPGHPPRSDNRRVPLVGIGINVKNAPLPPDIAPRAISLEEASGSLVEVADVETALLQWLTSYWDWWRQDGFAALLPHWHERLDQDARRAYVIGGETTWCRVQSLSADGIVRLEADDGTAHEVHAAHILFGE